MIEERDFIAGAGPVGLAAAANLVQASVPVRCSRKAPDRYDRQRRQVTMEYIEKQSIRNKRNLESDGTEFGESLRHIAADPGLTMSTCCSSQ